MSTNKVIIYNTLNPKKFARIVVENDVLPCSVYAAAKKAVGLGPYFLYYEDEPKELYRLGGPYSGRGPLSFFVVFKTEIAFDSVLENNATVIASILSNTKKGFNPGNRGGFK
jgi:hypothetical protein